MKIENTIRFDNTLATKQRAELLGIPPIPVNTNTKYKFEVGQEIITLPTAIIKPGLTAIIQQKMIDNGYPHYFVFGVWLREIDIKAN